MREFFAPLRMTTARDQGGIADQGGHLSSRIGKGN